MFFILGILYCNKTTLQFSVFQESIERIWEHNLGPQKMQFDIMIANNKLHITLQLVLKLQVESKKVKVNMHS